MFYIQYLTSLCERRSWAEPIFETRRSRQGWTCRVRVNNREYTTTGTTYSSEKLAQEKAAESAYFLCYNFSVNDGMYPGQRHGQAGVTQGLPVAIGTGRRQSRYNEYSGVSAYGDSLSRNSSRSPTTVDGSDIEQDLPASRKSSVSSYGSTNYHVCMCARGQVVQHSRCQHCLREAGWYYTN